MSIKDNLNEVNENLKKFASHGETPKLIAVTKTVDIDRIKEEFKFKKIVKYPLGCVIGAHIGPNLLSIYFSNKDLGDELSEV